jgi:HAMP domain-containing protein
VTEILKNINWTTIIATALSSGVVAVIIGIFQLIANRYVARALDHIEKTIKSKKEYEVK